MQLTLVTYTHNDAELVNALFCSLERWSVAPDKILVVDDSSSPPFEVAKEKSMPSLLLLRPSSHLGPAGAKAFGIEEAFARGADIVLSIDCDVRLHPNWLQKALLLLGREEIGLVGAELAHGLAGDALSHYLRAFEERHGENRQVPFLGAGVWLLRRNTWRETGGLAGHKGATHEDLYFCRKLSEAGLGMIAVGELPATQVRRIRYTAFFLRELHYLGFAVLEMCSKKGIGPALAPIAQKSALKVQHALRSKEPAFICLELVWVSSLLFWLAKEGEKDEKGSPFLSGKEMSGPGASGLDVSGPGASCQKERPQKKNEGRIIHEGLLSLVGSALAGAPALGRFLEKSLKKMRLLGEEESFRQSAALPENDFFISAGQLLDIFSFPLKDTDFLGLLQAGALSVLEKEDETFDFSSHYIENMNQQDNG